MTAATQWPEREQGVEEVLLPYRGYINMKERPELLSLLYDIDMLPEQCVTLAGSIRLAGLLEVWKRMEAAEEEVRRMNANVLPA